MTLYSHARNKKEAKYIVKDATHNKGYRYVIQKVKKTINKE